MIKKTQATKQLTKFRDQLHKLLTKYPELRITCDQDGDIFAWIRTTDGLPMPYEKIYLPTSGKQELISK